MSYQKPEGFSDEVLSAAMRALIDRVWVPFNGSNEVANQNALVRRMIVESLEESSPFGEFGSKEMDYSGTPPFANAEWAGPENDKSEHPMCEWCAGTGHPHGNPEYGMCECPDLRRPVDDSHRSETNDSPDEVLPTHRCRVCGAFWRYWLKQDTLRDDDSWSLVSLECGGCCDNAFMDEQILPVTVSEMREFLNGLEQKK